jgi:SAM-dependent methyltransferase
VLDIAPEYGSSALRTHDEPNPANGVASMPGGDELPFPNATFDAVLSLFGVMFAADDVRAAHELMRICKPLGRIGLTNWTPGGFMGRVLAVLAGQAQPPLARTLQTHWGDEDHLEHLFRVSGCDLHVSHRHVVFRCRSAEHCVHALRSRYSPVRTVFAALSPERRRRVEEDLLFLVDDFNTSGSSAAVVPSEYIEVVVLKK